MLLLTIQLPAVESPFASTANLPVAYGGRLTSLEPYSRLWLYDIYHSQSLKVSEAIILDSQDRSALGLLWNIHFLGFSPYLTTPLFWIHYANVKDLLQLDPVDDRFSFDTLHQSLYKNSESQIQILKALIAFELSKERNEAKTRNERIHLEALVNGLWVRINNGQVTIASTPSSPPWNALKPGMVIDSTTFLTQNQDEELLRLFQTILSFQELNNTKSDIEDAYHHLLKQLEKQQSNPKDIATVLETRFPLDMRLRSSGSLFKMLPLKHAPGEWVSLHALKLQLYNPVNGKVEMVDNFTAFYDNDFYLLRDSYLILEDAVITHKDVDVIAKASKHFSDAYLHAYIPLAESPYAQANGKTLIYPSITMLTAESWYYNFPFIEYAISAYCLALILMIVSKRIRLPLAILLAAFTLHTMTLILRSYILQRPPVSNMFETVIYVPWVALMIGFIFYVCNNSKIILSSAVVACIALLAVLKITQLDAKLENVQAVLDSQYWLIIHVLMVVGSYGAFLVCGIVSHAYLIKCCFKNQSSGELAKVSQGVLHTMYVGVALLIPGTILGGVWAAESWGRFWDWDPKESWAFITACVYLLVIHAYTFRRIADFGLAVGGVLGMIAVSFTWYGVNYVLGTGLHTYGFGKGGEIYYFLYLGLELVFLGTICMLCKPWRLNNKVPNVQ